MKKKIFYLALLIFSANTLLAQHSRHKTKAKNKPELHKVVFHLTSSDTLAWKGLINNIKNLRAGWADIVLIEVVANGQGIYMLTKERTTQLQKIEEYKAQGVVFYACQNTMRERKIIPSDMISPAQYVPSGVAEVIKKQEIGWSYIKAGF